MAVSRYAKKIYEASFTYMSTRAFHFELTGDFFTDSFAEALRRFIRGRSSLDENMMLILLVQKEKRKNSYPSYKNTE